MFCSCKFGTSSNAVGQQDMILNKNENNLCFLMTLYCKWDK